MTRNGVKGVRDAKLNEDVIVRSQQRDYIMEVGKVNTRGIEKMTD